jgi:hypothetical protein
MAASSNRWNATTAASSSWEGYWSMDTTTWATSIAWS